MSIRVAQVSFSVAKRAMSTAASGNVKSAYDAYRQNGQSFYQFPVDKIDFIVGTNNQSKQPEPKITFQTKALNTGLVHLSPVAPAAFCAFSERGNLGKKIQLPKASFEIKELKDASLELSLLCDPLEFQTGPANEMMVEYVDWLNAIAKKFVDHLAHNVTVYPALKQKFMSYKDDPAGLAKFLGAQQSTAVKKPKQKDNAAQQELLPYVTFKSKLYKPLDKNKSPVIYCKSDEEMKDFQRNHVPLFNASAPTVEVPVKDAVVSFRDVIIVQNSLRPALLEIAGNLTAMIRQDMRSVVVVERNQFSSRVTTSPFALPSPPLAQ